MKWFKRMIGRWAYEYRDSPEEPQLASGKVAVPRGYGTVNRSDEDRPWGDGLRINVKRINGGSVVTFFRYDSKTDRNDDRHYIITDGADFNSELGKLITMESMRY
jgi:hypothetical protein